MDIFPRVTWLVYRKGERFINISFLFIKELSESKQIPDFTRFFLGVEDVSIFSHHSYQIVTSDFFRGKRSICKSRHLRITRPVLGHLTDSYPTSNHAGLWIILETSAQNHRVVLVEEIDFWEYKTAINGNKSRSHAATPEMPICLLFPLPVIHWVGHKLLIPAKFMWWIIWLCIC